MQKLLESIQIYFILRKQKKIYRSVFKCYRAKRKHLSANHNRDILNLLLALKNAITARDVDSAKFNAYQLSAFSKNHFSKSLFDHIKEFIVAIGFALIVAILIRQTWFESYQIPTGSMRPTFKEQDRLFVSKNQFGVNVPLSLSHLFFKNRDVKRGGIVVFSGKNMPITDNRALYFFLFPGYKQYIKRMIGKPGDTLYFYGGKIYGIDEQGKDISAEFQAPEFQKLEHIPMIQFEGRCYPSKGVFDGVYSETLIQQMNRPIANLTLKNLSVKGKMIQANDPTADYFELWGMKNYAMARILTPEQVQNFYPQKSVEPSTKAFLELTHHPSIRKASLQIDYAQRYRPTLHVEKSVLPLHESHFEAIKKHLYTSRFTVRKQRVYRLGQEASASKHAPFLLHIPDGTYEFYFGKAYSVGFQSLLTELPPEHPLNNLSDESLITLYNLGVELDTRFEPKMKMQSILASRYAYFRDGSLYLMGGPIYPKDDPVLQAFLSEEKSVAANDYTPFIDNGSPFKSDGSLDKNLIRKFGLHVPHDSYYVLGDNHSNSGDSREFGFVPKGNLKGVPSFVFWGPGGRFGVIEHSSYPLITSSRLFVWAGVAILVFFWVRYNRRREERILGETQILKQH